MSELVNRNRLNLEKELCKNKTKGTTYSRVLYNYHVTLDKGRCRFFIATDAEYDEAYYIIAKWFLEERYSGDYDNLESLIRSHGYNAVPNGNDSKGIHINLNRVRLC